MITVTRHGHSCFGIEHADPRVLIDPFLSDNPVARVGVDHFPRLDAIIVTHGHGDHIGDAVELARLTGATVIGNHEISVWMEKRGVATHGMHIGGGHVFPFGHGKLTIAHHGSTGPEGGALGNPATQVGVVPMHYNTFLPMAADPHVSADRVRALGGKALALAVGETLSLPAAR